MRRLGRPLSPAGCSYLADNGNLGVMCVTGRSEGLPGTPTRSGEGTNRGAEGINTVFDFTEGRKYSGQQGRGGVMG